MTRPTGLISGGSIAGPALAFWLTRYGWATTVVERAPAFRTGGQNIDIRGAGREVLHRAGLEGKVREATADGIYSDSGSDAGGDRRSRDEQKARLREQFRDGLGGAAHPRRS